MTKSDQATDAPAAPEVRYIVKVTTHNGSYRVAFHEAQRALKMVADLHESGYGRVVILDIEGRELSLSALRDATES